MIEDRITPRVLGREAEELAAAEAARRGLRVLDRNWRTPFGELDLVAVDIAATGEPVLIVVEVKCRRSPRPELGPALAVGGLKQRRLVRAARAYLQRRAAQHGLDPGRVTVRFDVCAIVWTADGPAMTWLSDAFRPSGQLY